jgi:hypothetical protein
MSVVPFRALSGLLLLLLVGVSIRGRLFLVLSDRLLDISIMVGMVFGEERQETRQPAE